MSFMVTSLAMGQSYDCPNAIEVAVKNMGLKKCNQTTAKHIMRKLCA